MRGKRFCHRHGQVDEPCSCMLGKLSRLTEPVILLLLKIKGKLHGYKMAECLEEYKISDSLIDMGAMYRILRKLEEEGSVSSEWDVQNQGPARRCYTLSEYGEELLDTWMTILQKRRDSIDRLIKMYKSNKQDEK